MVAREVKSKGEQLMQTYLLVASATVDARATLAANKATIVVLRDQAPHLELVTLHNAVYHGRHRQDGYVAYTLNSGTGEGICFWDSNPVTCQLYRWHEKPEDAALFVGSDGQIWPAGLSEEQAQLRPRVAELCARILEEQKMPWSNAWEAQQALFDELEAEILCVVLPVLPEDLRVIIGRALAHHQDLAHIE
jgi:hypothetical protein